MEIMKTRKYLRVNWTNQKPMVKMEDNKSTQSWLH